MSDQARMTAGLIAKVAAQIVAGTGDPQAYLTVRQAVLDDYVLMVKTIDEVLPATPPTVAPQAQPVQAASLCCSFPGPPAPGSPVPARSVAQAFPGAQVQAHQAVGELTSDQLWLDVINNPNNWYNNTGDTRSAYQGGSGPDFRCKKSGPKPNAGLWLYSRKYGSYAPDWVFQKLGIAKPVPQQTAAVQPGAVPGPVSPPPGSQPVPNQAYGPDEAPF